LDKEVLLVHFGKIDGKSIVISNKPNSSTFSIETEKDTQVYSFDKTGRLWTALIQNVSYRRGLNGNIVAKWNSGKEILHRRWLTVEESHQLISKAHQTVCSIFSDVLNQNLILLPALQPQISKEVSYLSNISIDFYNQDVANYHRVYKPVGILPPDQYISVVLQLTEGCSFNKCTFCSFYRDRHFKIKNQTEFERHILAVKEFLGDGLSLRRTIFLGDANSLVVPMQKLIPLIELIHKYIDVEKLGGLFAFLDGFSGEKKTVQDYRKLKDLGLKKVYIGMESGNDQLLKFLNKPGSAYDALNSVHSIKESGLSVGIIILLGAGGKQYARNHISDTIDIINKMKLDADDLIYFSELIENEGMSYSQMAFSNNLSPLTISEIVEQRKQIEEGLFFSESGTPHISTYDIRDFVY